MTEQPRWRYLDQFAPHFPPGDLIATPPQVAAFAAREQERHERLMNAITEMSTAHGAVDAAADADRHAAVAAAGEGKPPPKLQAPKARERLTEAEGKVEAHRAAVKEARGDVVTSLWGAREEWRQRAVEGRERVRGELRHLLEQVGAKFDELDVHTDLIDSLDLLERVGGNLAGITFSASAQELEQRRQRREALLDVATDPQTRLDRRTMLTAPDESLAELATHLAEPPGPSEQAHALDSPAQPSALAAVGAHQVGN